MHLLKEPKCTLPSYMLANRVLWAVHVVRGWVPLVRGASLLWLSMVTLSMECSGKSLPSSHLVECISLKGSLWGELQWWPFLTCDHSIAFLEAFRASKYPTIRDTHCWLHWANRVWWLKIISVWGPCDCEFQSHSNQHTVRAAIPFYNHSVIAAQVSVTYLGYSCSHIWLLDHLGYLVQTLPLWN